MNGLDWAILVIIILSVVLAAAQGFFYELFSLAGVVVGYVLAAWGYRGLSSWFIPYVKNEWVANATAFLVIFVAVVILAGIAGRITRWALKEVGLRWFDRVLGAAFGILRGVLIVTVLVMAIAAFGPSSTTLAESRFGPYFLVIGRAASWVAPYQLRESFRQGVQTLRKQDQQPSQDAGKPSGGSGNSKQQ